MKLNFLLILVLCFVMGCGDDVDKWPKRHFDQQKWLETKESDRYIFVRDLIDRRELKGKTNDEVIRLLGIPAYKAENDEYVTYVVKAESGKLYILDIRFKVVQGKNIVDVVGVRSD